MIILGIVLFLAGLLAQSALLETIGIVLLVVGATLSLLGVRGHAVGGRRHYW